MIRPNRYITLIWIISLFVILSGVLAQDESTECPINVQQAFTATELLCEGLGSDLACLGNGVTDSTPREGIEDFTFSNAGDTETLSNFQSLRLNTLPTDDRNWAVSVMNLPVPTESNSTVDATLIAFGDVAMTNAVTVGEDAPVAVGSKPAIVRALNGVIVRQLPDRTTTVIWQLTNGENFIATGRSSDNQWLRIEIPNEFRGAGWVFAQFIEVEGGAESLPVVQPGDPVPEVSAVTHQASPMQAFTFESVDVLDSCVDTPDSGILIQSPNGVPDNIRLDINGVEILLNGTAFVRAQLAGDFIISILEGQASITASDTTVPLPSGNETLISLDTNLQPASPPFAASPYDEGRFVFLPIRLLPRNFVIAAPGSGTFTETTTTDTTTTETTVGDATTNEVTSPPATGCTVTAISVGGNTEALNLRAQPNITAEVSGFFPIGSSLNAIYRLTDSTNYIWYYTERNNWVRFDTVQATDPCVTLPLFPETADTTADTTSTPNPSVTQEPAMARVTTEGFGAICQNATFTTNVTQRETGTNFIPVGGTWTVKAGTTITFTANNPNFQAEMNNRIGLHNTDGSLFGGSITDTTLTWTFNTDTTFQVRLGAVIGDSFTFTASCSG